MNYNEAIDWLENIPISFDSNYDGYELKLVNIAKFLEQLGNPQNDLSLIHVGGTNGNCLLYTSPSPRDSTLSRMPSSA